MAKIKNNDLVLLMRAGRKILVRAEKKSTMTGVSLI